SLSTQPTARARPTGPASVWQRSDSQPPSKAYGRSRGLGGAGGRPRLGGTPGWGRAFLDWCGRWEVGAVASCMTRSFGVIDVVQVPFASDEFVAACAADCAGCDDRRPLLAESLVHAAVSSPSCSFAAGTARPVVD